MTTVIVKSLVKIGITKMCSIGIIQILKTNYVY